MDETYYQSLFQVLEGKTPFVTVTIVESTGSTPHYEGGKVLITQNGYLAGTIGGGKIEKKAIEIAGEMLSANSANDSTRFISWQLTKDLGMTCGGAVKLFFESFNSGQWEIAIFGAGHVAQALARTLIELDCNITCYDTRKEWLDKLPKSPRLLPVQSENLATETVKIPDNAFVIIITMGHSSDLPILLEILRTRQFPYLGLIGSKAKAAFFRKGVKEAGLDFPADDRYHCPIGLNLGSDHPREIAISITAQLIQERDRLRETP